MKYTDVKRLVRKYAAEHLYSLELNDCFDEKDDKRVSRAIFEIQCELLEPARRAERKNRRRPDNAGAKGV